MSGHRIALTIAGSDSGGGAGIQADIKTFAAFGVFGASAVTAITAQNTRGVDHVMALPAELVAQQIESVRSDFAIGAVKIGMLANQPIMEAVIDPLKMIGAPIVLDPVMIATSGDPLLEPSASDYLRDHLLPLADVLTPNLPEAARLLGVDEARDVDAMETQGKALIALGCGAVVVKGGHLIDGAMVDLLVTPDHTYRFPVERVTDPSFSEIHGTGCTLSSGIAAGLVGGLPLHEAVANAQSYVQRAIRAGLRRRYGEGALALDHTVAGTPSGVT